MPQILVLTDLSGDAESTVVYSERISPADFDSAHFSGQLAERVGWAVEDADRFEREAAEEVIRLRSRRIGGVAPPAGTRPVKRHSA